MEREAHFLRLSRRLDKGKRVGILGLRSDFARRSRNCAQDHNSSEEIRLAREGSPPGTPLPGRRGKSAGLPAASNVKARSATYRDGHALALPRTGLPAFPQTRRTAPPVRCETRSVWPVWR